MKTIENRTDIAAAYIDFCGDLAGAEPTSRRLPGAYESVNCAEYVEKGKIDGKASKIFWIFQHSEILSDDPGMWPWDVNHIDRIVVADDADETL